MQHRGPEADENADGVVDWPTCENVLRALSEDVRPTWAVSRGDDERVAADVRSCLAERVAPYESSPPPPPAGHLVTGPAGGPLRLRPKWRPYAWPADATAAAAVAAAGRAQTRFMAVRSAYADGKYYASDAPHASRTVEELSLWRWPAAAAAAADLDLNLYTYTVGTVAHDRDTGACRLRGLWDPRRSVAVDCGRLWARLPGHGAAVKMFSVLRAPDDGDGGAPVLVPHHFQVFRPPRRSAAAAAADDDHVS